MPEKKPRVVKRTVRGVDLPPALPKPNIDAIIGTAIGHVLAKLMESGREARAEPPMPPMPPIDAERTGGMSQRACAGNKPFCGSRMVLDHWTFCPYCATTLRAVQ